MRVSCPACGCDLESVRGVPLGPVDCPDCGHRFDLRDHMPTAARPTARRSWRSVAVVLAATAAAAGVTAWGVRPSTVPPVAAAAVAWDQAHRADLLSMKLAADAAALRGDLRGAYDGYARVLAAAAEHGVTDPVVGQTVAAARADQDRVFAALLGGDRPADVAAVVPAPASTRPAATMPTLFPDVPAVRVTPAVAPATRPATVPVDAMAAADAAPAVAHPPPPPHLHAYTLPDALTDPQIGSAIDGGIAFLMGRFRNGEVVTGLNDAVATRAVPLATPTPAAVDDGDLSGGSSLTDPDPARPPVRPGVPPAARGGPSSASAFATPGVDALCVYALLHAGQATATKGLAVGDPFVGGALARLKAYQLAYTYHRSLRAAALAVFDRPADHAALEEDVAWLMAAQRQGAYTYTLPPRGPFAWDNSNSQYGLLGVWSGAQAGLAVPADYWRAVERHWVSCGNDKGTWGYAGPGAQLTMTCAGVASLLVARDYLDDRGLLAATADRPSASPMADAGLARLDVGDNCVAGLYHPDALSAVGGVGYGLYGLERVGLASGFKYFGTHDWYAELARTLVNEQRADGSWGTGSSAAQAEVDTAYALLFLARGRHPILFNKLRYDGAWNDRPHDVAHLARFAAKQLERPLNWQVVNLRRDWSDWLDAPVLYVSGDRPPKLTDRDVAALRDYALGGGLIATHADGGSPAFTAWVKQFVRQAFPGDELTAVPKGHPLNSALFRLKTPPPLEAVTNGSRVLLVHSPTDVAGGWQLNWTDERRADFDLGLNLFVYAAGRADFQNRLASTYVPPPPTDPDVVWPVARLRYAGAWDPEPYAWVRFARTFQWETRHGLDVQVVDLKALTPGQTPLAVLTGAVRQDFTPAEAAAARAYVDAGGVLLVDACGGQAAFDRSARGTLIAAAFPGVPLAPLPADHPLLVPSRPFADDLRQKLSVRPFTAEQIGTAAATLEGLRFGRGWVIVSRLDLTTGLLGTQSWGILGYDPATARAVVKNAVLWAAARAGGR